MQLNENGIIPLIAFVLNNTIKITEIASSAVHLHASATMW